MPHMLGCWSVLALLIGLAPGSLGADSQTPVDEKGVLARSLVSAGDPGRMQRVLWKAKLGETVTVGVIGGSITQGASASKPEFRYGDRVAAWWRAEFPQATVQFVNAGIGATGSDYGALRVQRDLLARRPDFVIVEYAVNDPNTRAAAETLEGLIRQILRQDQAPAVMLLFTMHQNGSNAQEWQTKVGRHYGLPMVSFRDALWPEIQEGRLKWSDVEADAVHPNDRGHEYCARFAIRLLEQVRAAMPAESVARSEAGRLPGPLLSDLFEHVALWEADALTPIRKEGWSQGVQPGAGSCWHSAQPGSGIEFEVSGRVILLMDWHIRGPMGRARVQVDNQPAVVREGWFDQTWGGYRQTTVLARDLAPGQHRVRLELTAEKHAESPGYEFKILGLGAAGVGDR